MTTHPTAELVGRLTRSLPDRRWQAAHWLGRFLVPKQEFVGRFAGGLMEIHPGEVASCAAFFTGFYEREVTMWCLDLIRRRPPALVIDVGANFGYYPLLFGLKSGGKTASIAFEPEPSNFKWLSRNLALNPSLKIEPVKAAVGDQDGGTVPFRVAKAGQNLWARVADDTKSDGCGDIETVDVPTITLDRYRANRSIDSVDLTLIDVEGFESNVLEGMRQGIVDRAYRTVMVEFHPWAFPDPSAEMRRLAEIFLSAGYSGFRFRNFKADWPDKCRDFYRIDDCRGILEPLTFDNFSEWEHFLFTIETD